MKKTTANERFHASGGLHPQTVLWEFGSAPPVQAFVSPRPRKAATTLSASVGQRGDNIKSNKGIGKI